MAEDDTQAEPPAENGPEIDAESSPGAEAADAAAGTGPKEAGARDVGFEELQADTASAAADDEEEQRTAHDLEPVFDVPVKVQAVLGRSSLEVSQLLKLAPGAVLELDRKIGEAIDIYVNNRLVARGEVVLVEDHLGVTMTEIIKTERI